jgi:hypothetical protein
MHQRPPNWCVAAVNDLCQVPKGVVRIGLSRRAADRLQRFIVVVGLRGAGVTGRVVRGVESVTRGRLVRNRGLADLVQAVVFVGRGSDLRVRVRIASVVSQRFSSTVLRQVIGDRCPARQRRAASNLVFEAS